MWKGFLKRRQGHHESDAFSPAHKLSASSQGLRLWWGPREARKQAFKRLLGLQSVFVFISSSRRVVEVQVKVVLIVNLVMKSHQSKCNKLNGRPLNLKG